MPVRITPVVLNLIIINCIVFIAVNVLHPEWQDHLALYKTDVLGIRKTEMLRESQSNPDLIECYVRYQDGELEQASPISYFKPWQILSSAFTHGGFFHILMNMMFLSSIGTMVELVVGGRRFLEFYIFCSIVSGALVAFFDPALNPVVGASGALFGVFVAFAVFYPGARMMRLFNPNGIEARKVAIGFGVISAALVVLKELKGFDPIPISHFGHLMGMVAGVGYFYLRSFMNKIKR